jgi:hypothetical protein
MDIIKLKIDYLKKINKTTFELNRRLSFLNEINNSIYQNNMIGGSSKGAKSKGKENISSVTNPNPDAKVIIQGSYDSGNSSNSSVTNSDAKVILQESNDSNNSTSNIDVAKIISDNTITIEDIKSLIKGMKQKQLETDAMIGQLNSDHSINARIIEELKVEKSKLEKEASRLNSNIDSVSSAQESSKDEIAKLRKENESYRANIAKLSSFIEGGLKDIRGNL